MFYPQIQATADGIITHGGTVLATRTAETSGLTAALRTALALWRKPLATHDPAKILLDLTTSLIVGGACLADIRVIRGRPDVFGPVASDPTVSRLIATLATDPEQAVNAVRAARATARDQVWSLVADQAPDHGRSAKKPLIIDIDATLVTAHSEKEQAKPTYKRGLKVSPADGVHRPRTRRNREAAAAILRPGNAGSNTADDHITLTKKILQQVPDAGSRPGRSILTRTNSAGRTHDFLDFLTRRRLSYSVGFGLNEAMGPSSTSCRRRHGPRPTTPTVNPARTLTSPN